MSIPNVCSRRLALVIVFCAASGMAAEDVKSPPNIWSRFSIHGYLTQAFADADQHQVLGIARDGTADYRAAALQLNFKPGENDRFVVQVAHQRNGQTIVKERDVELDWGFYEHRFPTGTAVKIGRVQQPFGIYNELRDVGTVLPFYRIPTNYYGEGAYTNESVDGVAVTQAFARQAPWGVDLAAYYGRWTIQQTQGGATEAGHVRDAVGLQLWLRTPVDGLRVGGFAGRSLNTGPLNSPGGDVQKTYALSLDGSFDRWTARTEASRINTPLGHSESWYAEVSARVLPKLSLNAMTDRRHLLASNGFLSIDNDIGIDRAFGVNYYVRPDVVLKVEAHRNRALMIEDGPINPFAAPPRADYVIGSVSLSF